MTNKQEYDIGIVGAGIIGLAHAYFAARKGLKVVVFEKSSRSEGASIRNFGLIWPIGQDTEKLERAMRSRASWLKLSERAGFWVKANGSVHIAYNQDELDIITEFQHSVGEIYGSSLLQPQKTKSLSHFIVDSGLMGGLYSPNELTVNSREALPAITSYLEKEMNIAFHFNTQVQMVTDSHIYCNGQNEKYQVQHIIVTGGSDIHTLFPEVYENNLLVRTKLQMLKAESELEDYRLGPTLCGGLTLTHYKAFEKCKSLSKLNERISELHPDLKKYGIHVMVSQNDHGEFIFGDSHEYDDIVSPFNKEEIDNAILKYLKNFFITENIRITERWHGVYAKNTSGETELVMNPQENVTLVNGLGGAGMTLSFGLAEEIIDNL